MFHKGRYHLTYGYKPRENAKGHPFSTSLQQYTVEGYEMDALSHLVKPINYYDFAMKPEKAVKRIPFLPATDIILNTKSSDTRLAQEDIRYVEIHDHWIMLIIIYEHIKTMT